MIWITITMGNPLTLTMKVLKFIVHHSIALIWKMKLVRILLVTVALSILVLIARTFLIALIDYLSLLSKSVSGSDVKPTAAKLPFSKGVTPSSFLDQRKET